ncbi:MAG: hypothetical protein LBS59_07970 [Puniceicoccales bacterium]|jgi:hypothetical protein|nr:hypothetical protein [Puniceicoccales bacterium]
MAKPNPLLLVFVLPAIGVTFLISTFIYNANRGDANPFDLSAYRRNWNTLGGNEYTLRGQIDQQLAHREKKGRVISIKLLDGSGRVPVFFPPSINQNFEVNQRYKIRVRVLSDTLYAVSLEKF